MIHQCLQCGKSFSKRYSLKTPLCSRECRTEFRTEAATCRTCGQAFRATVRADKGAKKFCSKECWLERNPPFETECGFCGKDLVRDAHRKGKGHYCDAGCKAKAVRRELHGTEDGSRPCVVCGRAVEVSRNGVSTTRTLCGRDECRQARRKQTTRRNDKLTEIAGEDWARAIRRAWLQRRTRTRRQKERLAGGWKVRCSNAVVSLSLRPAPAARREPAPKPQTWEAAIAKQKRRLRAKRTRAEQSPWRRKCESTVSNLRKRRRRRNERIASNTC